MKRLTRLGLVVAVMGIGVMPMLAGSAAVESITGSWNATLSGEALVPNMTVFRGDHLQVRDGVAVVVLDQGNRMVFGRETAAANAAGCAENIENANENPGTQSPYTPAAGFSCP